MKHFPPPTGTFLAKVRDGAIHFPPPLKAYCDKVGWDLFRIVPGDRDRMLLEPILSSDCSQPATASLTGKTDTDPIDGFCSSLSADGRLWIPDTMRKSVSLQEQGVMMRVENGLIGVYLRKVFDTLGFRP